MNRRNWPNKGIQQVAAVGLDGTKVPLKYGYNSETTQKRQRTTNIGNRWRNRKDL